MKAILEFTLPDESDEHQTALDAGLWKAAVWDLDQWLRTNAKHGEDSIKASDAREELYRILGDHGLELS